MAKTAYFDCFSGASGDMVLGALIDAGLPLPALREALGSLAIEYGDVGAERVLRSGIAATKFIARSLEQEPVVPRTPAHHHEHHAHGHTHAASTASHHHDHHSLTDIYRCIERSALSRQGKDRAIQLFQRLAEAEATIHNMPLERVHLHEVGALDSIIDIVGAVYGMEWLGVDDVVASALNVGGGMVTCAHGTFPVPAPATVLLLRGVPVYSGTVTAELVTPTGALLITGYAGRFGPLPEMRVDVIGYGAGDRDFSGHPNVLRLLVGDTASDSGIERIVILECEIDDMNPQLFGPLMDALYAAGALEVFYTPVMMKKSRPGTLVTVIAAPDRREALAGKLFAETTTIGVRYQEILRERLEREIRTIETPVGRIRFKVATRDGHVIHAAPEFDDCAGAAAEHGISIKDVQAIASKAWLDLKH